MSQGKPVPRVSSGVPWWIWLGGIILTAAVILGIYGSRNTDSPDDLFIQAVAAADAHDGERLMRLKQRLVAFPDRQDLIDVLDGVVAAGSNRDPRAIKLLTPHIEHENPLVQRTAVKYSAMAYQRTGQALKARQMYERAVELDPDDLNPHLLLARMNDEAGAYGPAMKEAQAVLSIDAENAEARALIGGIQMEQGQWTEATDSFAELLSTGGKRASASPDVINRYLACLMHTQQADKALDFLNENAALVSDPGVKVSVLIASGEVARAEDEIDQLTMGNTSAEMLTPIDAKAAMIEEDWKKAVGLLREQVRLSPRASEGFRLLEEAATKNNESELAQAAAENLAAIRDLENQLYEAIQAIGTDVEDAEQRIAVARLFAQLGRQDQARDWLIKATKVATERQLELLGTLERIEVSRTPLVPLPGELAGTIFDSPAPTDDDPAEEEDPGEPVDPTEQSDPGDSADEPETANEPEPADAVDEPTSDDSPPQDDSNDSSTGDDSDSDSDE